jgi:hypothetical protein
MNIWGTVVRPDARRTITSLSGPPQSTEISLNATPFASRSALARQQNEQNVLV